MPTIHQNEFTQYVQLSDVVSCAEARAHETINGISERLMQGQEIGEGPLTTLAGIQKLTWQHAHTEAILTQNLCIARDNCPTDVQISIEGQLFPGGVRDADGRFT